MQGSDECYDEEEAARIYAQGLLLIQEGDSKLTEAFRSPQKDEECLLELLLLQREAIAKQLQGLTLIDAATEMRYEALKNRQHSIAASTHPND
jgi:hypothetical protein